MNFSFILLRNQKIYHNHLELFLETPPLEGIVLLQQAFFFIQNLRKTPLLVTIKFGVSTSFVLNKVQEYEVE